MSTTELPEDEKASQKNKGGRPKGRLPYGNHKLNIYLSDEDYDHFKAFCSEAWNERNASGAGRHLILYALGVWEKKGRKKVTLDPSEWS